jgi:hypothetical protein
MQFKILKDYIANDQSWIIRYIVVKINILGRKVLLAPSWIDRINWATKNIHVSLSRQLIKKSPKFNYSHPVNLESETRLYDYFGRPKYWENDQN